MIVKLIISVLSVWVTAWLMDGVTLEPWWAALIVAVVLGCINAIIRPVFKLLSFPVNVITLGLFTFVINALMVMLCAWLVGDYFQVNGFFNALIYSIILSVVGWVLNLFAPSKKK